MLNKSHYNTQLARDQRFQNTQKNVRLVAVSFTYKLRYAPRYAGIPRRRWAGGDKDSDSDCDIAAAVAATGPAVAVVEVEGIGVGGAGARLEFCFIDDGTRDEAQAWPHISSIFQEKARPPLSLVGSKVVGVTMMSAQHSARTALQFVTVTLGVRVLRIYSPSQVPDRRLNPTPSSEHAPREK